MDKLLRFGTLAVCLGFTAPTLAQTYYDSAVPADSSNCRAVAGQAEIDGTMQQIIGRACLQSDGTWQLVQNPDGSELWYPVTAYPYPDPWYWGPPLFIGGGVSFIFVDRFHHFRHFRHFDHFHQMDHNHFGVLMGAGFHHRPFPGGGIRGSGGMSRTPVSGGMHVSGGTPVSGGMRVSGGTPVSGGMRVSGGIPVSGGMRVSGGIPVSSGMHGFGGMRRH